MRKLIFVVLALLAAVSAVSAPARAAVDPGLLAGMKARSIGPAGMSGRVAAIDAVESNPNIVYVGAATGGVWKSVNGGLTWEPIFDDQPVASIGAVAVFQANPDIVWVGTGEGNPRNSVSVGNGVYRSLDGGRTWTAPRAWRRPSASTASCSIPRTPTWPGSRPSARSLGREPRARRVQDRGRRQDLEQGALRRRADRRRRPGDRPRESEQAVRRDVAVPALALVLPLRRPGLRPLRDPGRRAQLEAAHRGRTACRRATSGASASPSRARTRTSSTPSSRPRRARCVRSDDGGKTWQTVNQRHDVNPRPFYFADIRVDPELPNRVYNLDYDVRVSDDGGQTFDTLVPGYRSTATTTPCGSIPRNPDLIYLGNDGGVADQPRPRPDRRLRHQPAARPVLPRGRRHGAAVQRLRRPAGQRLLARPEHRLAERRHPQPRVAAGGRRRRLRHPARPGGLEPRLLHVAGGLPGPLEPADRRAAADQPGAAGRRASSASTGTPASPSTRSSRARSTSAASSSTSRPTAARPGRRSART